MRFPNRPTSTGVRAVSFGPITATTTHKEKGYRQRTTARERERVAAEPVRYLKIPGLDHGQHHEILRQFLQSDWTPDDARRRRAREAYFGSIGAWKKEVRDEEAVDTFRDFRGAEITKRAEEFLRENRIDPEWK